MRDWLKEFRCVKGYTHEGIANKCNISRSYYTHIENGTKTPSVEIAKKIGGSLNFDWTIFFGNRCSLKEQKRVERGIYD
ncbi:TPA: helix-turn-helix transcriptional regulator [Bacillus cereus]|uniref:Transcriptional regulator n=1 Tax=Bacillus thuringiensis serovar kumamotoensis TaxID=132267 RepID=A0A9X6PNG7_BACUK|nr:MULTISPECIES: helix-turn-helix transcriptional regulator [Bacillus cereus group]EKS7844745.1 helix-turn-helix transcriptional regulator [Bacillus cereus]MCU5667964.1 helix-turn-helix domain-containing protein [Bacillus cereus]MEC2873200.1 helix-turn-helix transcriptional regulator [Bacillus cereus]OTZ68116.1 transcriptional regulator [Bacillus thuringiensis serovar kumamtoensis]PER97296.1 XRE family transcriptional regulator [Bacillus cereus]